MSDSPSLAILGSTVTALAVLRSAHALGLRPVLVDNAHGVAADSRYGRKVIRPGAPQEAILKELMSIGQNERTVLIADSDAWIRFIQAHRPQLEEAFTDILHPGNETLSLCLDKEAFGDWCAQKGFLSPRTYVLEADGSFVQKPEFPVLFRPRTTRHGMSGPVPKAVEARNEGELAHWLRVFRESQAVPAVSQSLLRPGIRQYSVCLARNRQGAMVSFVAEKLRPIAEQCATGSYVVLSPRPEVEVVGRRVADELDYYGIAEVEVLHDDATGESFVIEVNARPWAQYPLAHRSGHDFLTFLLRHPDYDATRERKTGFRWLSLESDLYAVFSKSIGLYPAGRIRLMEFVQSVLSANSFALFDWRDPRPFVRVSGRFLREYGRSKFGRAGA